MNNEYWQTKTQESNLKYTFVTPEGKLGAIPVHSLIDREKPAADLPKVILRLDW